MPGAIFGLPLHRALNNFTIKMGGDMIYLYENMKEGEM